ncbi:Carbohydrate-binding, CenC-like protein [Cynara cardunculus var. scolymus]|uniref:Carbohydrate-binding, CenC-like protein n=1 Tax=Cynara cardunculus var. scolymus TaxID=59895 RepID=A0A103YCX0_CYNCS|nr:Carbohydrate-binding, CenC-like protein [Cynara cardunculus var. scolymus]
MEIPITSSVINANHSFHSQTRNNESNSNKLTSNMIDNHDFRNGLDSWYANCCDAFVVEEHQGKPCNRHALVTNRNHHWQGLEQDVTTKISCGSSYTVSARVGVSGECLEGEADVIATLKLEYQQLSESDTKFLFIAKTSVSRDKWENLEGTFVLSDKPDRLVFYLEGPAPGINLLIESVLVLCHDTTAPCISTEDENIILNPEFEDGVNNWSGRGCKIALHDSMGDGKILPKSGKLFASATERTQNWNGIQQDISGRVQRKLVYEVSAFVRIFGNKVTGSTIRATLWVQTPDSREQYIGIASSQATDSDWVQLQGKFLLNASPSKVVIYLEGPPSGTDILLDGLMVKHAAKTPPSPPPVIENLDYGVNIIANSNLRDGTSGWFPLGSCMLSVVSGSPRILPPAARDTLGPHEPLNGRCIQTANRTQTWMGPAQMITDKVKLYVTYQVSAWVRLGPGATGPQNVNVALGVDSQWVNGGQVEINDAYRWHEICGSFRIEKQAAKVMVYIQGPAAGISFMVAGLQIFAIRKRDVTLKFDSSNMHGTMVAVKQTRNSFPIGSCISRTNIDNEDFVAFLVKNFNWAVFGNELKWYWTESQRGNLNYKDADELLKLCDDNNIAARGHCIFWDVDNTVQDWVKNLNKVDLTTAVQNRLTSLLNRYKGQFKHYDVNNEMLHGSFYPDRLGQDTRANMFKTANQLDPSTILFVNDYHIEDGCDTRSTPEKYIAQILDLQQQGAPVGGIGIQGHIDSPVGPVVYSALEKLGVLGLPIWFTELDVSSINEHIRADDLEVMFREAFAHPAVEGIMIWGFWELFMSRENSHLVNAEGEINEAGNRFLQLKKEWLSHAHGHVDDQSEFKFRGFPGTYEIVFVMNSKKVVKQFVVDNVDIE